MKKIGSYLMGIGILAIILNFVNMVPRVLMWIYTWGETTAWAIKIGVIILGAVLFLIGKSTHKKEETNG